MERYPQDLSVGIDDFRRSGWKLAIASGERDGYSDMSDLLSAAARSAIEGGKSREGKVLWLLADACSMVLKPDSANEPFKPHLVMNGKRSAIPEDFQQPDIELLSLIAEEVDDPWLQGRVADLVWLLAKPRSPKHALLAIDAYRRIPLNTETWWSGGQECWERAIRLSQMLGASAGERIPEIEATLTSVFESTEGEEAILSLWLANLMASCRLVRGKEIEIGKRLESLARQSDVEGDLDSAGKFSMASAEWFRRAGDAPKTAEMIAFEAEAWVKKAFARISSSQPSYMIAADFYEKAIQTYRSIPRNDRPTHHVDERISELYVCLKDARGRAKDEMCEIRSSPIDITQFVENARNAVKGKSAIDALAAFANIYSGAQADKMRQKLEKTLFEIIPVTYIEDDRVVAKDPGIGLVDGESDDSKKAIWANMVRHYTVEMGIVVKCSILPALETLSLEHRLREGDFVALANHSPIVPIGRAPLFGKALFAGYDKDFVSALHLLVPQIEHMVRRHLKAAGIKTTSLDKDGIENEIGLSALMDISETTRILGEDLSFEFKALFCSPLGPNLRNKLAHGLLDEEDCRSVYAIYAWWLGLRLVFNTFWNASRKVQVEEGVDEESQS